MPGSGTGQPETADPRSKIDDRRTFGSSRWEAPTQDGEVVGPVLQPANDRRRIGRPDVFARLQVGRGPRPLHRDAGLAKGREIVAVRYVVPVIIAHWRSALGDVAGTVARWRDAVNQLPTLPAAMPILSVCARRA